MNYMNQLLHIFIAIKLGLLKYETQRGESIINCKLLYEQ